MWIKNREYFNTMCVSASYCTLGMFLEGKYNKK